MYVIIHIPNKWPYVYGYWHSYEKAEAEAKKLKARRSGAVHVRSIRPLYNL